MNLDIKFKIVFVILVCGSAIVTHAQQRPDTPPPQIESRTTSDDDVIRIKTDLIQTGVAVFDKKGQFVKDLRLEDFELEVNGKPVSVSFFEENRADAARTEKGVKAAKTTSIVGTSPGNSVQRGRNIIFVVDDLHLSVDSHVRTRKLIFKFIDEEMRPNDTVAVVSSTGKIGFLQQFTNDKTVLRSAVERLKFSRDRSAKDQSPPPMTEYEALLIMQGDPDALNIFAAEEIGGGDLETKREFVRSRARAIVLHMAAINRATYSTLEQAIRSSDQLPGRKIVFFISDGFLLDPTTSNGPYLMQRITDAAARTNTVIYAFEAKGLEAGFPEGTTGRSLAGYRIQAGERFDKQDPPSSLADETGGRFIKNTNDLNTGLANSIAEASQYYLLAWQPVSEAGGDERFRKIEVKVRNRPELKVRVHRGYLDNRKAETEAAAKAKKNDEAKTTLPIAEQQLNAAATSLVPLHELPTSLSINFLDIPNEGTTTGVAVKIDSGLVEFSLEDNKARANIDVLGIVYNSEGKRERFFRELVTVDGSASAVDKSDRQDIYYNYQTKLKPGLYQVRVATRDVKSGRAGSALGWVEIPDLTKRQLALSSLILSERVNDNRVRQENISTTIGATDLPILVDRRVERTSELRYMIFVYNAAPGATRPDVTIQTKILRDNQLIVSSQPSPISTVDRDPLRLPYAAEVSLRNLPTGRYELIVTVEDRIAKSSRAQQLYFEIR